MNYSLLVMESAGMMKMATGEGFPLRQGARMGPDWFSVATEASGGEPPNLSCVLEVLGQVGIYGCRRYVRGAMRVPEDRGARPPPS